MNKKINIYNQCSLTAMKEMPNNYYDVAIVDPPYGIGEDWKKRNKKKYEETNYTNTPVGEEYFNELKRISKNQIIWGYNYYTDFLGPTNYLIIWDKCSSNNNVFKYSKCEIAYTSFKVPAMIYRVPWDGYRMGKETGQKKIHPHQKPVELYKKIIADYITTGAKIIDSHGGSMSLAIACLDFPDLSLDIFEIEKKYYDNGVQRIIKEEEQLTIYDVLN